MPDNSYRTFLDRAFISYDSDGKPVKIIGAMQDISERKRTEDAIRENEERYRTLVEQATDAIFIITMEGRLVTINDSGCKLSGYAREELMQMTLYDVVFEEDLVKDPFRFDELAKGNTIRNERRMKRKDGMAIDVEVTAKLLTNGDLLVFGKDISERKKAETQITESEQRLIRAEKMGSLGHGFYEFEKDKITLSAGLYDIFGVSPDSFSHTLDGLLSVIHPGDKAIQEKALETLLLNGEVEVEFRIQTPDGEIRNVQFKTVLSKNSNGEFINSFTTAIDLTESRKAEEKIRKNNDQLRQLAANLQNIREKERARIGREIHDELGQWLTVLKMEISRVNKIKNDETKLNEAIEEMLRQVYGFIQSSRKISTELRPTLIDDLGLIAALE
jgi:PAS domain S-box-containing protein